MNTFCIWRVAKISVKSLVPSLEQCVRFVNIEINKRLISTFKLCIYGCIYPKSRLKWVVQMDKNNIKCHLGILLNESINI